MEPPDAALPVPPDNADTALLTAVPVASRSIGRGLLVVWSCVVLLFGLALAALGLAAWSNESGQSLWLLGLQTQQWFAAGLIGAATATAAGSFLIPAMVAPWLVVTLRIVALTIAAVLIPVCFVWFSLRPLAVLPLPDCYPEVLYSGDIFTHSDGTVNFYAPSGILLGESIGSLHVSAPNVIPDGDYKLGLDADGVRVMHAGGSTWLAAPCS